MGNRLSKIVTKTGDKGETGLADGQRVAKDNSLIEAIGDVDELNSFIGFVISETNEKVLITQLKQVQQQLFNCGGDLCLTGSLLVSTNDIQQLENEIETMNQLLPPLKNFILPGGNSFTSRVHLARSIARRAERRVVTASKSHEFNPLLLGYLNRLSDWLFVLARYSDEGEETLWKQ